MLVASVKSPDYVSRLASVESMGIALIMASADSMDFVFGIASVI